MHRYSCCIRYWLHTQLVCVQLHTITELVTSIPKMLVLFNYGPFIKGVYIITIKLNFRQFFLSYEC